MSQENRHAVRTGQDQIRLYGRSRHRREPAGATAIRAMLPFAIRTGGMLAFCLALALGTMGRAPDAGGPQYGSDHHDLGIGSREVYTGLWRGRLMTYVIQDGLAIAEGDMILGTAEQLAASLDFIGELPGELKMLREETEEGKTLPVQRSAGLTDPGRLWPGGVIPFTIDPSLQQQDRVTDAVDHWNANTAIQLVPRNGEADFVTFIPQAAGGCSSNVGRIGGQQFIRVGSTSGCQAPQVIHEIGHTVGFAHEQQRDDRDSHVAMMLENVDKRFQINNFLRGVFSTSDTGPYDHGSIMHYTATLFSRNRRFVIETIPAGMPIGTTQVLSAGDIDGVNRLYGLPRETVVTSNPPGLEILVDGAPVTTPATVNWSPGSNHTIVATSPQMLNGNRYLFGKWSDGGAASHSVMASPGNTIFIASFIEQFPLATGVIPEGAGTVSISPNSGDGFFTSRSALVITPQPAGGFAFSRWFGGFFTFFNGLSSNPVNIFLRDSETEYQAFFLPDSVPQTTIDSNVPGLFGIIDGNTVPLPLSSDWTPGSTHTISVEDQQIATGAERFVFESWSDGGARTHSVEAVSGSSTVTANFAKEVLMTGEAFPSNGGSVEITPTSPDGFYPQGTTVQVRAVPANGFEFIGWLGDLSGAANPQSLTLNEQGFVQAAFRPDGGGGGGGLPTDTPIRLRLDPVGGPSVFTGGLFVDVPDGAMSLRVDLETETPDANVDLLVRQGADIVLSNGSPVADFTSEGPTGEETIVITPASSPPLAADSYFVGFRVLTFNTEITITLVLAIEGGGGGSPPVININRNSLTFTSPQGSNPPAQTVNVSNSGGGTLSFQVSTATSSGGPWLSANPAQGTSTGNQVPVTVSVDTGGLSEGTFNGTVTISEANGALGAVSAPRQAGPVVIPVTLAVTPAAGGPAPSINNNGIVDAARFARRAAPGGLASLFGTELADGTRVARTVPLPLDLLTTSVTVNGIPAPLIFVSALQINFQIPWEVPTSGNLQVVVTRNGVPSVARTVPVAQFAPGIFQRPPGVGGPAALRFPDNSAIDADNPAVDGDVLQVFITGVGGVTNQPMTGSPAGVPLSVSTVPATATIAGGVPVTVLFAGLAPTFVGLGQVNIVLPDPLPEPEPGETTLVLLINFGDARSQEVPLDVAP